MLPDRDRVPAVRDERRHEHVQGADVLVLVDPHGRDASLLTAQPVQDRRVGPEAVLQPVIEIPVAHHGADEVLGLRVATLSGAQILDLSRSPWSARLRLNSPSSPADRPTSASNRAVSTPSSVSPSRRRRARESNPAAGAERPKLPRRRWRILEPVEVARVAKAFTDEQARTVFLTLVLTGVRRSELQALRWRDVDLVDNVLRVRDSKSEDGIRSIALSSTLAEELWQHRRRSSFQGDGERVFCHPERGTVYRAEAFEEALRSALGAAGVEGRVRAFHDLRHTAITNDAAAGANPVALMTKAGHADMKTTRTYMHMAGVVFRDEAERLEARLLGARAEENTSSPMTDQNAAAAVDSGVVIRQQSPAQRVESRNRQ